jgi:2-polyprenyl-6-methoxyphenol hydroxylase-like FAD-dependent oxidoreductase
MALAKDPDRFQALCERLPSIAPWVSADTSEPMGGVHGFGMMDAFWRRAVVDGKSQVTGFFFLGDTAVRSNPKFGRGCTWAAVAAHQLAEIIAGTNDPTERLARYEEMLEKEFRADWETMLANDRSIRRQFEVAAGLRRPTLRDRLTAMLDARLNEAMIMDPDVFRAIWSGYHGFTGMAAWTRRPEIWLRLLRLAVLGPGKFGSIIRERRLRPTRPEMFKLQPAGSIR